MEAYRILDGEQVRWQEVADGRQVSGVFRERLVVLGQVATGFGPGDLKVGSSVELVLETLEVRGDTQYVVWKWRPTSEAAGS